MIEKKAQKQLQALDAVTRRRIAKAIEKIPAGDIKKLKGTDGFRLRVGDYRVLFSHYGEAFFIKAILLRGEAYKR